VQKTDFDEVRKHFREAYKGIFPNDAQFERHFKDTIELETSYNLLRMVQDNTGITPDTRILDIGCGFGTFVLACRKEGYPAYGIDTAEFEIEFARKRFKSELPDCADGETYQLGRAEALPFESQSFDIITLWNLLEHVPDYRKALGEADRVLKQGGYLLLISPNYLSLRREAHYHIPWIPLLPRVLAKFYLRANGRNPSFFINSIFYVTNLGVLRWLRGNYRLVIPEIRKVQNPDLCISESKASLLRKARLFKVGGLLKILIHLVYLNPLKKGIVLCARKKF